MSLNISKIRDFLKKHERILVPIALVLGVLPDIIFFAFVSFGVNVLTLGIYLVLAAISIFVINLYEAGRVRGKFYAFLRSMSPLTLHFCFGALFTSFILFYSFSGSLFSSWPFILILAFLVIANEAFAKYNARPEIHLTVFFFALFSYLNLAVPYLLRSVSPAVFIGSGALSLLVTGIFIWILHSRMPHVRRAMRVIGGSIAALFIAMNVFYFTNLIPPIPLSTRDIGVYYNVEHMGGEYRVLGREIGLLERLTHIFSISHKFPLYQSHEAYVFSAIFAPPDMDVEIIHEWQFKERGRGWETRSIIPFPIVGGRDSGFRGYSRVSHIEPGNWRVNVKTTRGQIISQYRFKAIEVASPPAYSYETK